MCKATPHFDAYRANPAFAPRMPDLSRQKYPDEIDDLSSDSQVSSLLVAPDNSAQYAVPIAEGADEADSAWLNRDKAHMYLWLVQIDDVKICLENGELGKNTQRTRLSHTNLSGNVPAHCGGELWFKNAESIYLNGGSSRFTARDPSELAAVVDSFRAAGYKVCSFGWNEDTGAPKRTLRKGEVEWL